VDLLGFRVMSPLVLIWKRSPEPTDNNERGEASPMPTLLFVVSTNNVEVSTTKSPASVRPPEAVKSVPATPMLVRMLVLRSMVPAAVKPVIVVGAIVFTVSTPMDPASSKVRSVLVPSVMDRVPVLAIEMIGVVPVKSISEPALASPRAKSAPVVRELPEFERVRAVWVVAVDQSQI